MAGRECYHCKQWVEEGEAHDCWTTTEAALTRDLSEELRDAWDRLRETAAAFGDQRIYASHKSIMFSRKSCYFFVRPKQRFLEVCVFLGRTVKSPQVRRVDRASQSKMAHLIRVTHRDEVEAPITDWLREAYELEETVTTGGKAKQKPKPAKPAKPATAKAGPAPKLDRGKQLTRVRRICGSIPGITEKLSHGAPTFFTPKRVFAMFADNHHDDGHVAVWLPAAPGVQAALIEEAPETYFRPPYVGVSGWIGVEVSKVGDEQLGALIREAFRVVGAKPAAPRSSKPRRKLGGRKA
jgi:hypothetical protein